MDETSPIDPRQRARRMQDVRAAFARAETALDVGAVLVGAAAQELGAASASAYAFRDDGQLHCIGLSGVPPSVADTLRVLPLDMPLPLSEAVRRGRPIWLEDRAQLLERYPHLKSTATSPLVVQASVAFPLSLGGTVLGGVAFGYAGPFRSTETATRRLAAMVLDATLALARCNGHPIGADAASTAELMAAVADVDAQLRRATDAVMMARGLVAMASEIPGGAVLLEAARNASLAANSAAQVAHALGALATDGTTSQAVLRACLASLRVVTQHCSDTAVSMSRVLADIVEDGDVGAPARPDH